MSNSVIQMNNEDLHKVITHYNPNKLYVMHLVLSLRRSYRIQPLQHTSQEKYCSKVRVLNEKPHFGEPPEK